MINQLKKYTPKLSQNWYFDFWFLVIAFPFVLRGVGAFIEVLTGYAGVSDIAIRLIHDIDILLDGFYVIISLICILSALGLAIYDRVKS